MYIYGKYNDMIKLYKTCTLHTAK